MDSVTAAAAGVAGPSDGPYSRSGPLLVGRTLEQLFLREELAAVCAGRGRLVGPDLAAWVHGGWLASGVDPER